MNTSDQELIMAFHDGHTSSAESDKVKALIASDPQAAAYLAGISKADDYFNSELDRVLDGPIPDRLIDAASNSPANTAAVVSQLHRPRFGLNQPRLALAASFMAAVMVGLTAYVQPWQQASNTASPLAALIQEALDTKASGERLADASGQWLIMPTATYRSPSQGLCRQFAGLDGQEPFYGVSCRSDGDENWTALATISDEPAASSLEQQAYVPASAPEDDVTSYIIDAELISISDEEQLIRKQWR